MGNASNYGHTITCEDPKLTATLSVALGVSPKFCVVERYEEPGFVSITARNPSHSAELLLEWPGKATHYIADHAALRATRITLSPGGEVQKTLERTGVKPCHPPQSAPTTEGDAEVLRAMVQWIVPLAKQIKLQPC